MCIQASIITVNLNNATGLQKTIDSVINQTYTGYEFLIIDGDSSDESLSIIKQYKDRITYWVSEPDRGIYHAMNKGIEIAKGRYCLFLNSGDWLVDDDVLEKCFRIEETADLLVGNCQVSKDGQIFFTAKPTKALTLQSFYGATIPHQSTFIRRNLFDKLGLYRETYKIHGDYEFWIRSIIIHHCSLACLDLVVSDYNMEGLSTRPSFAEQSKAEIRQILQQYFPERVLSDYETWRGKEAEIQFWQWVKSKKILSRLIQFIYYMAVSLVALKKKIMPSKTEHESV